MGDDSLRQPSESASDTTVFASSGVLSCMKKDYYFMRNKKIAVRCDKNNKFKTSESMSFEGKYLLHTPLLHVKKRRRQRITARMIGAKYVVTLRRFFSERIIRGHCLARVLPETNR